MGGLGKYMYVTVHGQHNRAVLESAKATVKMFDFVSVLVYITCKIHV